MKHLLDGPVAPVVGHSDKCLSRWQPLRALEYVNATLVTVCASLMLEQF